jgi:ribosome-associated toxin RatA of RatAB toxin-antitoxin module
MYALVNDIEAYPSHFAWCSAASVLERSAGELVARLDLRLGALSTSFTTRNRLVPDESIALDLVEGPFRALRGQWRFRALGDSGCKVSLDLDFEPAGKLMGTALAAGFQSLADRLVGEFVRVALAG